MNNRKKLSEFAGLEVELPKIELPEPNVDISSNELQHDTHDIDADDEGAMVKADLYKLAKYSVKLFKKIEDQDQFEAWVQAKITKAADYISSVYHYLEYEMKFSEYGDKIENSDMYSESEKRQMKNALMEAKKTLAALKIDQADKLDRPKAVKESVSHTCGECGGSGMVEKPLPEATKTKVDKYNRQTKAFHAAHKRIDANHNGIPDDEEGDNMGEESVSPVKKPSPVADKKGSNPFAKKDEKKSSGGGDAFKKELDTAKSKSASKPKESASSCDTGNPYASKKEATDESFYEGKEKPSKGLSTAKKSAVVKKAKAGGDIGKPGKNFDKVAKSAGGGEKGKKIAAAAMWKNVKESVSRLEEKKAAEKADKDYDGDGKIESGKDEHKGSVDKAIKASKEKDCMNESVELSRLREITSRVIR